MRALHRNILVMVVRYLMVGCRAPAATVWDDGLAIDEQRNVEIRRVAANNKKRLRAEDMDAIVWTKRCGRVPCI